MNTKTLFSSASGDWTTPPDLFDKLWDEFGGFDLDPCCAWGHHSLQRVLADGGGACILQRPFQAILGNVGRDGLAEPWFGKVYLNPPYGREIVKWVEKAWRETAMRRAKLIVALLPARTDTRWWQGYITRLDNSPHGPTFPYAEVRFLPGRLKFGGAENAAPFPSAVVIWRGG